MTSILTLIIKQRNATMEKRKRKPKAILLVGGLGGNKYLYQHLQAEFSAGDIDLVQPQGDKAQVLLHSLNSFVLTKELGGHRFVVAPLSRR